MSPGIAVSGTTRVKPEAALSTCQNWSTAQGSETILTWQKGNKNAKKVAYKMTDMN